MKLREQQKDAAIGLQAAKIGGRSANRGTPWGGAKPATLGGNPAALGTNPATLGGAGDFSFFWVGVIIAAIIASAFAPAPVYAQNSGTVAPVLSGDSPALSGKSPALSGNALATIERWKQREKRVQDLVKNVSPAVVAITDGESFGSGVVVSRDGLVLTAGHVIIEDDREFQVMFPDGRTATAKALGKNLNQDAGMMQITDEGTWPYADVGQPDEIRRGDWVVAMGHSGGYDLGRRPPVRLGRVLRTERDAYTSDCAIIGGDSGGPLFDLDGKLVGIHSSIGDSIAENRHVTIGIFSRDWDRLSSGETWGQLPGTEDQPDPKPRSPRNRRSRPDPLEELENLDPSSADPSGSNSPTENSGTAALGVELERNDSQAVLRLIKPNSAAQRVGLQVGDVVVRFNDVAVDSPQELVKLISGKRVGDSVKVEVRRDGRLLNFQIILGQLSVK